VIAPVRGNNGGMARSIWGGAISFGLVNVPVKLFTAVRKKDVRFHQLHAADGARINQKRVCSADGEEVAYEDVVKGYEIAKGQYVVIEPEELEALDPESTHTIDIEDFVDLDDIDPLYFDASYYVLPDARGEKAYRLLLEAMRDSGKVGIARVVMRTKQYLVAIRPVGEALVMSTMNFADEVVPQEELEGLPGQAANVSDRELTMARQLIESLSGDFEPAKYEDTYREKVLQLIEQKAAGREVVAPPAAKAATPVVDLMAALEASLAAAKGDGKAAAKGDGKGSVGGAGEKAKKAS
jgi:DNA end-binding protein Ku